MSTKWRIYCREAGDEGFKYVWSDTAPTTCPNDSDHDVNPNSINVVAKERIGTVIRPNVGRQSSKSLARVDTVLIDPEVRRIRKIVAYSSMTFGADSYTVELFDVALQETVSETTFTNTKVQPNELTLPAFHSGINELDINVKVDYPANSQGKRYSAKIEKVIVYTEG